MPFETQWFRVVPTSHTYSHTEGDGRRQAGHGHRSGANTDDDTNTNARVRVLRPDNTQKQETQSFLDRARGRLEEAKRVVEALETKIAARLNELDRLQRQVKSAEEEVVRARRERDVRLAEREWDREWEREKAKHRRQQDQERERERARKAARRMVQVFFT